ncbi:dipeptidase [Acetivibrio clariflavus]|uniref:Zn-dependent dipeptidase, microsomal dipeptidase n=1 Tax=Acetivibrio clariflavus (strain DSM 19732 / NBRC 101661 / EBR45) TaxID=720554 RepID=G8LU26_ACECE|nr:dipeptidase [Acetivibrio clariflavus]AEV68414.1 Zn-dependent dipeptidase, microsomal dipeptidase [Acetivibrio clariflavus DSM 19732]
MIIFDAHCDTITKIMELNSNLYSNNCHIDILRLKKAGNCVQTFAAFIAPIYSPAYAMKRAMQIIDRFYSELEIYKDDIMLCCNYNDIETALSQGKIAAMLSIEGGEALQGDLGALRNFYRLGVRSVCLTWNYRNEIADGVKDEETGGGLTPFGRQLVAEMNRLGMLVDLSHISQRGFWDVMATTSKPVIVSHSNARKICSHPRNLYDDQILAVAKNGGVIGINFYPEFLNDEGKAFVKDIIKHIEHIVSLAGPDHIGIGADFDGIEKTPEDIKGIENISIVFEEMAKLNYSDEIIRKFASENFLRLVKDME